jgi:hypothetical protein
MAAYEVLLLNTAVPQIQAAQSGDTYVVPRDIAINATAIISANSATDALRITQTGAGNAILVEDSANPDSTPFVVNASGIVGIGTTSPTYKLDVVNTSGSVAAISVTANDPVNAKIRLNNTSGQAYSLISGIPTVSQSGFTIYDETNSTSRVVLDSSGNVGVGTLNPVAKLDVYKTATVSTTDPVAANVPSIQARATTVSGKAMLQLTALSAGAAVAPAYIETGAVADFRSYMNLVYSADGSGAGYFAVSQFSPVGSSTTERMRIDSSGNLGLGVTPNANWSSFNKIFQFGAGALANFFSDNNTMLGSNLYFGGSPSNWRYISTGQRATLYRMLTGAHEWHTTGSTTGSADGIASALTQAMTLTSGGDLLVGTTTSSGRLTVQTDGTNGAVGFIRNTDNAFTTDLDFIKSRGSTASPTAVQDGDNLLRLRVAPYQGSAYTYLNSMVVQVDGTFTSGQNPPTRIVWNTNAANGSATERARITSGGYFKASNSGSYDSSTGTYHELYQTANSRGVLVRATNATYTSGVLDIFGDRTTTNSSFDLIRSSNGNATGQFFVRDSGNALNTNGSYGAISDQKLKQDIVDAGSQWADLKAVRFRKYRMKADVAANPDAPALLGVVAQELEQVSPGLVEESPDRDAEGNDLGTTTKSVKTSVLLMKAAVALQEAMARIEQLEAKVASLGA